MKQEAVYRLGEFRINEYENGILWWEAHHALGKQGSGKRLVHDHILIIGLRKHEEIGFLKLESFAKLHKLPA
jgi:hypothetical protein